MCFHARITILEQKNLDQKAVLEGRKRPLSGKRLVIDGKHLMTAVELIGVREAEEVTKQKKVPKGTRKRKDKSKAKKELSDEESEAYLDITDDDNVKIFDCIAVEM